jgi:hypothetical protein
LNKYGKLNTIIQKINSIIKIVNKYVWNCISHYGVHLHTFTL